MRAPTSVGSKKSPASPTTSGSEPARLQTTGTPQAIVDKLNTEINRILSLPHIREVWRAQGATPVVMTPTEFGGFVQSEIERWAKIIKANGIQGD